MKPSRRMTFAPLSLPPRVRTPALGGALLAMCLSASCGVPPDDHPEGAEPESATELVAQSARVPQATRVDPATAFAGATPLLTITGRNFTPDLRVYIEGSVVTGVKVISTTQAQVALPAGVSALGKKLLRVENPLTFRGSERDDLFSLTPDPLALLSLEQSLDGQNAKLVATGDVNGNYGSPYIGWLITTCRSSDHGYRDYSAAFRSTT
jgi:hypothetical protein